MSRAETEYRYEKLTWPEIEDASGLGASALAARGGDVEGLRAIYDPAARFVVTNDAILEPGAIGMPAVVNLDRR